MVALVAVGGFVARPATAGVRTPDSHPLPPAVIAAPGQITQVGEIVVLEGDDSVVTTVGAGTYGISSDQMQAIANKFYMMYPDEFDGLAVFTTFPDELQGGFAYALIINAGFGGVGIDSGYSASQFGSDGRLISFINMNDTAQYGPMDENDGQFHSVFGQEFGHTWLSRMQFRDSDTGQPSNELLGRDNSHWSAYFNSGGSVMDGAAYTDNGDGSFSSGINSERYGPLDLYAMGIYSKDEVTDLYVIRNATYQGSGQAVGPADIVNGETVLGTRHNFTMDDIIAVMGPRTPAWDAENEDFRIAFILVTKPGETADQVSDRVAKLEVGRLAWEKKHLEWTDRRSTMCTDVTAYCPLGFAEIIDTNVIEDPDDSNGNGVIEPGENARLEVTFSNQGTRATTAMVELTSATPGVTVPGVETIPEIPVEGQLTHPFYLQIDGETCGSEVEVDLTAKIENRQWKGSATFIPGLLKSAEEPFDTPADWQANIEGRDSATQGKWEHGVPSAAYFAGRTLQPDGGAGGTGDKAWITGLSSDWADDEVIGATTLTSATYDLDGVFAPILRYKVWYLSLDRVGPTLMETDEAHLTVEASDDGGDTWVEIDRVSGAQKRWEERIVKLAPHIDSTKNVVFRFTVFDDKDAGLDGRIVEAGIDDVALDSLSTICRDGPSSGGCCSVGERPPVEELGLFAIVIAIGVIRRRRRIPSPS
jgi:hypothetical protein